MRLYEFETADIFEGAGIPVPRKGVAASAEEAVSLAGRIGYPVMLKAQVLGGGRGLAGGIQTATTPEAVESLSKGLLGLEIRGMPVRKILVAEKAEISREIYLGVTVDGFNGRPVVIASTAGGVHIEEAARASPEKVRSMHVDPEFGFYPYHARSLLRGAGLSRGLLGPCSDILARLYSLFVRWEALTVEINPLAALRDGRVLAVDARMEIDDSAVFRVGQPLPTKHIDRFLHPLERRGREIGVTYVDLDGDIGIISSGAGLGMATMDIIGRRLRPANFLETGGGITAELMYRCMELLMMKQGLRAVFINIFGGINPIHEGAKGVVRYIREHGLTLPVVAKALGNCQEETWEIFRAGGVHVVTERATETAVERLVQLVGSSHGDSAG